MTHPNYSELKEEADAKEAGKRFKLSAIGRPFIPIYVEEIKQIEGILLAYKGNIEFRIKVL